jgi:hypothetical protein
MNHATCKYCGRPIVWSADRVPLEPETTPLGSKVVDAMGNCGPVREGVRVDYSVRWMRHQCEKKP